MKIRTWAQVVAILALVIAAGVICFYLLIRQQLDHVIEINTLVNNIIKIVNQREKIANDYLIFHEDEAVIQWQVMYDVTVKLLQSKAFNSDEEQSTLEDMRQDNVIANRMFTELIILNQNKKTRSMAISLQKRGEYDLKGQLIDSGESIIFGAYRLAEISQQASVSILKRANIYTLIFISMLAMLIFLILFMIKIKIINPFTRLNEAIYIVANGGLHYPLNADEKDEVGQIFRSFNKMAIKLQERTIQQKVTQEELQKSNEQLQHFAYIASHDLQEPLRMISSYLQLIARRYQGKLDKNADEFIMFAIDGANRLQIMINDLLMFSRVKTQGRPFTLVNLEGSLKQAMQNLSLQINESHAVITHEALPVVYADASQMVVLFQNLLSNAIKFRSHVTPSIHLSVEHKDKEWLIGIHDNGIGIDPKEKDHIFVIFKRLVGREVPGTGIGLATCQRIVERHQGKIWVESDIGKGSTFYFTIPEHESFA